MQLSDSERSYYIDYLMSHTTYSRETINGIAEDDYKLFNMANRIKECMDRYPKEIFSYLIDHPEVEEQYTLDELKKMKYNDLVELRKLFKIRKKSKKIVSAKIIPEVAAKARKAAKANPRLEQTIILNTLPEVEDLAFLTPDEIETMYPGSGLYSDEELRNLGIVRENAHEQQEIDPTDYYIKIATIVESGITVDGNPLTLDDCYNMPVKEVERLYQIAQAKTHRKDSKAKKKL